MGVNPIIIHSASFDTVLYAFAIFMFISLCTVVNFFLWLLFSKISSQTGAPYRKSGCIPPVYSVFKALWLSPQFSFAEFDKANIIFLHFSVTCVMCSLNVTLLSIIIPKYFMVLTCLSSLLFKYTSKSFLSFFDVSSALVLTFGR